MPWQPTPNRVKTRICSVCGCDKFQHDYSQHGIIHWSGTTYGRTRHNGNMGVPPHPVGQRDLLTQQTALITCQTCLAYLVARAVTR